MKRHRSAGAGDLVLQCGHPSPARQNPGAWPAERRGRFTDRRYRLDSANYLKSK
jgi:hypothetical protein